MNSILIGFTIVAIILTYPTRYTILSTKSSMIQLVIIFKNNSYSMEKKVLTKLSNRTNLPADSRFKSKMKDSFKWPEESLVLRAAI